MAFQLSKNSKLTRHSNAVAAGTTDVEPTGIDTAGFESCLFAVSFGTITSGAVTSIKLQQSTDNSSFADLEGTAVTVADTDDNKVFWLDIHRPRERYIRCVVDRGTANAVVDSILAIQYNGVRVAPPTHDATTVGGGEAHSSPAEGTA